MTREAYSHEVIAFGFWPGDNKTAFPAFYSYTAPAPAGLTAQPLSPEPAWWQEEAGSAYLRYSDVRGSNDPEQDLLDFSSPPTGRGPSPPAGMSKRSKRKA